MENKKVNISVKTLYEKFGTNLVYTQIVYVPKGQENPNCEYYDLYNNQGNLMAMDGEQCEIIKNNDKIVILKCYDGEVDTQFTLTKEEFLTAIFKK